MLTEVKVSVKSKVLKETESVINWAGSTSLKTDKQKEMKAVELSADVWPPKAAVKIKTWLWGLGGRDGHFSLFLDILQII